MTLQNLIDLYTKKVTTDAVKNIFATPSNVAFKNLSGGFDVFLAALMAQGIKQNALYVLHDKTLAQEFFSDFQKLFLKDNVLFFPTSYLKPYEFEDTQNANILMRTEVLNRLKTSKQSLQIITYPEALIEKVVNKKTLTKNSFLAKTGDALDTHFIEEWLLSYAFEKTDFVYEPGQFSIRGGIVDVFSFVGEYPYRVEFFGENIESIRLFNPENQLSIETMSEMSIVPNVQHLHPSEKLESFFDFLSPSTTSIWFKDLQMTLEVIDKGYQKAQDTFHTMMLANNHTQVVVDPSVRFENKMSLKSHLDRYKTVEFGHVPSTQNLKVFDFNTQPQPPFHKNFTLLAETLIQYQNLNYKCYICSDNPAQLDRLDSIFNEIDKEIQFQAVLGSISEGFIDHQNEILLFTDHQIFDRHHQTYQKPKFSKAKSLTLRELKNLNPGDYVVHSDYGIGRFAGLETIQVNDNQQETLRLVYRDDDLLYVGIHSLHKISKYAGKESTPPHINKLGSQDWENKKKKVKRKVKDIAKDLIKLYAKRKESQGFSFQDDDYMQAELESSFLYQDTPDQAQATEDVKSDMKKNYPMDRLVCGDVGFGKTEIAIRATFKAVSSGKQVAVLVPTTILALQHFQTFTQRFQHFPVKVAYINRFKTIKQINESKKLLAEGKIDVIIGTHRIVNKDMVFKDLGLLIIDEEQKFGVRVKEKLKEMKVNVDTLTLTATPIPRTLHFSLMGARDLSIINTPPPNRRPVATEVLEFNHEIIRDAISYELKRGGQVFFVHNRISDIENVANIIYQLVPEARIAIGHGQMKGEQLEKIMLKFINGETDVLVSTNIIESGLDIPNANTIIINRGHTIGLSDLHQMRGRVGRSNIKAYCYILIPSKKNIATNARKRLLALEEFSDLGDGFKLAMRDLDIRGAGDLLGSEQSGFISDLGFEMYHKILDDAVAELKETEFTSLFDEKELEKLSQQSQDCLLETDLELLIPEYYIQDVTERLSLYNRLDTLTHEDQLLSFSKELIDRFGPMPESLSDLLDSVRLRWQAISLGFEKLLLKNNTLKGYLSTSDTFLQSKAFSQILNYIKANPLHCKMQDNKNRLIIQIKKVTCIKNAQEIFNNIQNN